MSRRITLFLVFVSFIVLEAETPLSDWAIIYHPLPWLDVGGERQRRVAKSVCEQHYRCRSGINNIPQFIKDLN